MKNLILYVLLLQVFCVAAQTDESTHFEALKQKFEALQTQYTGGKVCQVGFGKDRWDKYHQPTKPINEAEWLGIYSHTIKFPSIRQKTNFPELLRLFKHDESYKGQSFLGLVNVDYFSPTSDYSTLEQVVDATQNPFEEKHLFVATIIGTPGNDVIRLSEEFLVGDFQRGDSLIFSNPKNRESFRIAIDEDWHLPEIKEDCQLDLSLVRAGRVTYSTKVLVKKVTQSLTGNRITYLHLTSCDNVRGEGYDAPFYDSTQWVPEPDYNFTATATIPYDIPAGTNALYYTGWHENDKLTSPYGKADVSIIYAEGRNYLKKPLIFLDGFEPFDARLLDRVNANNSQNNGYLDFQLRQFQQLWCETCQPSPGYGKLVKDYIREGCYDIVIVNWHGGADFVQRNAFALIEVLNQLNAMKVGDEPNVLVGPSMGGVIANYALAYAETYEGQLGVNAHEVGVFVSDDAPLYGANIPIGVQYAMAHLYWNIADLNNSILINLDAKEHMAYMALMAISSPCALQILNYTVFGSTYVPVGATNNRVVFTYQQYKDNVGNDDIKITELRHHPFFDQLTTELNSIGNFPKRCQLLAMANASGAGTPHRNKNPITNVLEDMLPEELIFTIDDGNRIQGTTRALPETGTDKIISDIDLIFRNRQTVRIDGQGNMAADHAPGGFVSMLDQLEDGTTAFVFTKHFCHEYLNSTLGFDRTWSNQNGNFELTLCDKTPSQYMPNTPFDRVYFPCYDNTKHTWIPQDFLDFLDMSLKNIYFQNRTFVNGELNVAAKEKMKIGKEVVNFKPIQNVTFSSGGVNGMRLSAGQEIKLTAGTIIKPSAKFRAYINPTYKDICLNPINRMSNLSIPSNDEDLKTTKEYSFTIFPNPTNNQISVNELGGVSINKVSIIDISGKTIKEFSATESFIQGYFVGDLPVGLYLLKVTFEDGTQKSSKLLIQR